MSQFYGISKVYDNLFDSQKKELLNQGQKKSLEIIESASDVPCDA